MTLRSTVRPTCIAQPTCPVSRASFRKGTSFQHSGLVVTLHICIRDVVTTGAGDFTLCHQTDDGILP
jgi:hypothetical protein